MILVDRTGRKLKPGQLVDVRVDSLIVGQVVEVHDTSIAIPGQQQTTPYVLIHLMPIPAPMAGLVNPSTGIINGVYIIQDTPPGFEKTGKTHDVIERDNIRKFARVDDDEGTPPDDGTPPKAS